jgi:signal transduction histidine kinase
MSLLEILQLVGYGAGAALTLWMGALLLKWRRAIAGAERVLLALAVSIGLWHFSNLILILHTLLGLERSRWHLALRLTDSLAIASIVVAYSLLLHLHLYLWTNARNRKLSLTERVRVYLSYIPALFLVKAIPQIWRGDYAPMLEKLAEVQFLASPEISFVQAFTLWAIYVLAFISVTDILISRLSADRSEKRFMQTLAGSFLLIASLICAVYVLGVGHGRPLGSYLATLANLGSLLPTALMAQRIYRQRFLDLVIRESLVIATFAAVVLIVYLFGIRAIGAWSTAAYGVRSEVVEALLILTLALGSRPLRKWLEKRFHMLFEREAKLYREVVARIGAHKGEFQHLPALLSFVEERTSQDLALRRVRIIALEHNHDSHTVSNTPRDGLTDDLVDKIVVLFDSGDAKPLERVGLLKEHGYAMCYPLLRQGQLLGLMLVDAPADALTKDLRGVLEVVAGQVALAIEDHRLLEENVRLELRLAQEARLAVLGQMAATVAHEVKNPLSAIKSIAQVLLEDKHLNDYERDLELIVGETDRLNNSVTQLLKFARRSPESLDAIQLDELIRNVLDLFRAQATRIGVGLEFNSSLRIEISGVIASALRDALSNLLLNALQASAAGGIVKIESDLNQDELLVTVTDSGAGIEQELKDRIWEPFFTTRQRGTGLGLAIVRKRIDEVGGTTNLALSKAGEGTRFELRLPMSDARYS